VGVNDEHRMPGHCWAKQPGLRGVRCFEQPGHGGDHYNWHTRDRWPNRQPTAKAAAQAKD
jgi:hypothetical protein